MSDRDSMPGGEEDFAAMFAASEKGTKLERVRVGEQVRGTVISVGAGAIFVALGDNAEASIDPVEFRDPDTGEIAVAEGDTVEATVIDDGRRSGSIVLRRMAGRGGHLAAEIEQAFEHDLPVEGIVSGEVKGGYEVQLGSMRAFCPGSQIDLRRGGQQRSGAEYVGQRLEFRITKLEEGGRNIVVSRRDLLERIAEEQAERTWETIEPGAVLDGKVVSIRDFGAFVDLGGVEGMIHVSELGWQRVKHPEEVLNVGQKVRVQVLGVKEPDARGRRQIALSLKALATDPWTKAAEDFPAGTTVVGTVRRLETFGAFVEIAPAVEGLVHISKISPDRRLNHARQALDEGQQVEVTVLSVDPDQRRISLSMVEEIQREREATAAAERREELQAMAKLNAPKSLGTLGDLLAQAEKDRK
jgi:small subunit ribosomal protein S1